MDQFVTQAKNIIDYISRGVELAAALVIAAASAEAIVKSLLLLVRRRSPPEAKNEIRLTLGRWLAVALEFELAAASCAPLLPRRGQTSSNSLRLRRFGPL